LTSIFDWNLKFALALFILFDLLCVGMGMGVPIFCILFGFAVGWYIAKRISVPDPTIRDTLRLILKYAIVTSLITFVMMGVIWGRMIILLFDPASDLENFGVPMILYEPKASFFGWMVLMIFISPFLQLLTTIFASYLTLQRRFRNDNS
jgi:hypothetical protein